MNDKSSPNALPRMPHFFADDCRPTLRHTVHRLESMGRTEHSVLLRLREPDYPCSKEIWGQHPQPGSPATGTTPIDIQVHPETGPFADRKSQWHEALSRGMLSEEEVSHRLWMLGKLEWLFESPYRTLDFFMESLAARGEPIIGLTADEYCFFTPDEHRAMARSLFSKPNCRIPRLFAQILQAVLGISFVVTMERYDLFPHYVELLAGLSRDKADSGFIRKIDLLERLFLPVCHETVYLFHYKWAILDNELSTLDNVQLN